jgi:hypothetical protein
MNEMLNEIISNKLNLNELNNFKNFPLKMNELVGEECNEEP